MRFSHKSEMMHNEHLEENGQPCLVDRSDKQ